MRIKLTDADYEAALFRQTPDAKKEWARLKAGARQAAAQRTLKENSKRAGELIALLKSGLDPAAWTKTQRELDRLFEAHDKLLEIAYPRAATEATHGAE